MSLNINDLALAQETVGFVAKEAAYGILEGFAAGDAIGLLGTPEVTQNESFTDSEEKVNSRSQPNRFRDKTPAGSWNADLYSRPSGAAGSVPVEDVLLECALGAKTVNAGTSVVYTPAIALPSFSFGSRIGHVAMFASGCVVEELGLTITNKGALKWSGRGSCAKVVRAGETTTVADSTTTVIKLATGGAELIDVGSRVRIGSDDNSGDGFAVTAVDEAADAITVSPAMSGAPSTGETVRGFLPTASLGGAPLQGRLGQARIGSAVLTATQASLTISNEVKMIDDVLSDQDYPEGFIPGQRGVSGSLDLYFLREYLAHFRQAKKQTQLEINLHAGNLAGSILTINLPQAEMNTPTLSGDLEVKQTTEFKGMPSPAFEDELSITFT